MTDIEKILMKRDGMTKEEANELLVEAREAVYEGENPEDVLKDYFGLEPDYIFDII